MADSSGMTLMDLMTSDPKAAPPPPSSSSLPSSSSSTQMAASSTLPPPSSLGKPVTDRRSKRNTLMQIQNDTISAAKAVRANIMPQKQKKRPVSYAQLARSIHELAATSDQKNSQRQLVNHVFPKLAVYNSVDPSLAPSLLMGLSVVWFFGRFDSWSEQYNFAIGVGIEDMIYLVSMSSAMEYGSDELNIGGRKQSRSGTDFRYRVHKKKCI